MAETWNETTPAGTENPKQGDDRIRELKRAIRERLAADHHFESTEGTPFGDSGSEIGFHKKVILIEQASDPITLANEMAVYCKDDGGTPEVFIRQESNGTVWQVSKGAKLLHNSVILPEQGSPPSTAGNQMAVYTKEIASQSELFARCESDGTEIQLTSAGAIVLNDHAANHISSEDEIDGDKLDIDWNPSNYTPATTPAEADDADDLTAHLYGIDQKFAGLFGGYSGYISQSDNTYRAYSNTTATYDIMAVTLPGAALGPNGFCELICTGFCIKNDSGTARVFNIKFWSGSTLIEQSFTVQHNGNFFLGAQFRARLCNENSESVNSIEIEFSFYDPSAPGTNHVRTENVQATINTGSAVSLKLQAQMATAHSSFAWRSWGGRLLLYPTGP